MDTSVQRPSCYALFDPVAPECAACGIQADCMNEQAQQLESHIPRPTRQEYKAEETTEKQSSPKEEAPSPKESKQITIQGDAQYIPEHTRKPLEIPPVGSTIQTTYRGQTYEALIVDDPSNKRMDGRSILFNGTVYRTLTAAAHAISPGINSGSVWQQI